ncbi:SCO2322 family protein [Streptomyces bambusae]|uniref:Secreted protein n=1 Tax=Streptomyces bambusae TaxID=1550616 RepID=A0ABS6ZE27_9ACTN|nr:SCO2322 family protein [Streptomyces bambusae]MBW5485978.1 hypothetical protein [Streptomyces bambusae]
MTRHRLRLSGAVVLALLTTVCVAVPAQAAGYRYWSFWEGGPDGRWAYASQGPSQVRPADGTALGFRFAVSKDAAAEAAKPGAAADFAAVCAATAPAAGRKRVAVVIDFGLPEDAPSGETPPRSTPRTACAQVGPDASAAEALAEVAKPLRYNSSALLCAIAGYPKQGCGDQVTTPESTPPTTTPGTQPTPAGTPSAAPSSSDGGPSLGLLAGIAAVAALATAAVLRSRRHPR